MTREEYLKNPENHRQYYGQFVNLAIMDLVAQKIKMSRILASTDPHMNDIPLVYWDTVANRYLKNHKPLKDQLKAKGGAYSLAVGVCILKEAARQLKENRTSAQS